MNLHLRRIIYGKTETIGNLYIDGAYFCDTLEDVVRKGPKIRGKTAIPAGEYPVIVTQSPKFKRLMPLVCDVPNFTGIRIHRGNTHEDTAGCILVGKLRGQNTLEDSIATEVSLTHLLLQTQQKGNTITLLID